jgi:serine phosphatase RsbU (regulator of sigma subunit)
VAQRRRSAAVPVPAHLIAGDLPGDPDRCVDLPDGWDAAPLGRRFVEQQVRELGEPSLADDSVLVAAELIANARQHGIPPVRVCVDGGPGWVRVEVLDASPRGPVRLAPSLENMTGRGLAIVEAVAARWGVRSLAAGGKSVWAELSSAPAGTDDTPGPEPYVELLEAGASAEPRYPVVLGDVPTGLLIEAKAQMDNIVRELSLAGAAGATVSPSAPLASVIETVVTGFSDARNAIKRQALAAAERGDERTHLLLDLPASAADAGEAYLAALDEADEYSRAGRLLTLETQPDHRLFRRWYVQAVVQQIRDQLEGRTPQQPVPFEDLLITRLRQLSAAQRVGERAGRLHHVTAALAGTRTPEDVAAVVVSEGVDALGASGGGLLVPAADGEHLALPGAVGYAGLLVEALRDERLDAPLPAAMALRTGEAIWLETQAERDARFPALRGFESDTVAMCAVPLVVAGETLGALRFSFAVRKLFDEDERAFVLALAAQTAQTLQRTELYQRERAAALRLQRALLPQELPQVAGIEVAAYYSAAGDQEAGGDFYDLIQLRDGRAVAFIGDVMGRGLEAAAAMAEIRSTIRAYAIEDPDPVTVFRRVDTYFGDLGVAQLVTMLYLLIDPTTGTVRVGNAGHLPPLHSTEGRCDIVPTALGTPFGVGTGARASRAVHLRRGDALVGVTDGLVERRDQDIDDGIARVRRAVAGSDLAPADLVRHVVESAAGGDKLDDDVTVFVVRRV